jgi:TonB family protein
LSEKKMMTRHCALLFASFAFYAAPLSASTPDEPSAIEKANGEFLFKHYPPRALAAGEQGQVGFRVTLDTKGILTSCDITKSSGFMTLDAETCDFMVRYAKFEAPEAEGRRVAATREGYVNWKLPAGAKAAPKVRKASLATGSSAEKLICRRDLRTGSLVSTQKRCVTKKEWDQGERVAKENAREAVGKGWKQDGT